jgi:hypothetical protein
LPLRGENGPPPLHLPPGVQGEKPGEAAPDGGPAIGTKLIIPLGLAISCIAHLALLTPVVYLAGANPFDTAPADAITVDIVSPEEAGEAPKPDAAAAGGATTSATNTFDIPTAGAPSTATPAEPSPQPQPPSPPAARATGQDITRQAVAQAQPAEPARPAPAWLPQPFAPAAPEPAQPEETDITNMFAMPLTLPGGKVGGKYDSQAVDRADISNDSVAAFRNHLKTCSTRPAGLAPDVKVVMRVYLKPDGSLAAGLPQNPEPIKVDGVSTGGGALFQSAVAAVRRCQPYKMLPPERYEEWKRLDVTFTPQNF